MKPAALLGIVGAALLLSRKRAQASAPVSRETQAATTDVAPTSYEAQPGDPDAIFDTSGHIYIRPIAGDTVASLAATFTNDPNRWRELRDVQPSRTRRAQITSGVMSPSWWLLLPDVWTQTIPDNFPDSRLAEYADAIGQDPAIGRTA